MKQRSNIKILKYSIEFANWFSENYVSLNPGTYRSKNGKIEIQYFENLYDMPGEIESKGLAYRVSISDGIIQLSKDKLLHPNYTNNSVWAMVIWCIIQGSLIDHLDSDAQLLWVYLEHKKPIEHLLIIYQKQNKESNMFNAAFNKKRLDQINNHLKSVDGLRNVLKQLDQTAG